MRILFLICSFISLAVSNLAIADTANIKHEYRLVKKLNQKIAEIEAKNVWPNNKLATTPTFIYFDESEHTYARAFKPTNPAWFLLPGFTPDTYFLDADNYQFSTNHQHYGRSIDGQGPTFVFYPPYPKNENMNVGEAILEHYSYITSNSYPFNQYIDREYSALRSFPQYPLARLELFLALQALTERLSNNQTQDAAEEALKNYIAVNTVRLKEIDAESKEFELHQQYKYGLWIYLFIKSFYESIKDIPFIDFDSINYEDLADYDHIEDAIGTQQLGIPLIQGLVTAALLDEVKPDWKTQFVSQNISPIDQLKALYPLTAEEAKERVQLLKDEYKIDQYINANQDAFANYWQTSDNYFTEFKEAKGVEVSLVTSPDAYTIMIEPLAENYHYLSVRGFIAKDLSETIEFADDTFLSFSSMPYLYTYYAQEEVIRNFKLAKTTAILIDKKPYTLEELLKTPAVLNFTTLSIASENVQLEINSAGSLLITAKGVTIKHLNATSSVCDFKYICAKQPARKANFQAHKSLFDNFQKLLKVQKKRK
ncbi:MAG: hypothetical protein A3F18_02645 [Legionellales bacterium RIFCSPHIGHO2_12_FULL_37_14]|nr:MAG: hypothetical protein A3F18_02645 [Legionellales bacterium RIFCSPHIGHO2_12_FULL_37_14]